MAEYYVATIWSNVGKIAACGVIASILMGGACLLFPTIAPLLAIASPFVGAAAVLLAALRWDTHTIGIKE